MQTLLLILGSYFIILLGVQDPKKEIKQDTLVRKDTIIVRDTIVIVERKADTIAIKQRKNKEELKKLLEQVQQKKIDDQWPYKE